jgi:hypothetical protein
MMMKCTTYANWESKKLLSLLNITKLGLNSHSLATMNLHQKKSELFSPLIQREDG